MNVKCLEIIYEEGWYSSSQNTKKRDIRYEKGCKHWDNGNGWQRNFKSSSYYIMVKIQDIKYKIFIDRFFKDNFGRLIEKRRTIIENTMPQEINVQEKVSPRGTKYYIAVEDDLQNWLNKCNELYNK